jgi:hypothetical protein
MLDFQVGTDAADISSVMSLTSAGITFRATSSVAIYTPVVDISNASGYYTITNPAGDVSVKLAQSTGLQFGDGTNPMDTNLYRSAANQLKTDDSFDVVGVYKVDGTQVVSNRVVDARIDDAINDSTWDSTTAGVLDAIRDAMITHGLIAAS